MESKPIRDRTSLLNCVHAKRVWVGTSTFRHVIGGRVMALSEVKPIRDRAPFEADANVKTFGVQLL